MAQVTEVKTAHTVLRRETYSGLIKITGMYVEQTDVADLMLGLALLCPEKIPDHIRASLQRVVECEEVARLNLIREVAAAESDDGLGPDPHAAERARDEQPLIEQAA